MSSDFKGFQVLHKQKSRQDLRSRAKILMLNSIERALYTLVPTQYIGILDKGDQKL
jgi:hypothetical protein